jgi:hypothetical protein
VVDAYEVVLGDAGAAAGSPHEFPDLAPREYPVHEASSPVNFLFVNVDEDYAVLRQEVASQRQALVHVLQPHRVSPGVFLVHEAIIIDEIVAAGVVGRVDEDALDAPGEGHSEVAEGVVIVTLYDKIAPGRGPDAQVGDQVERYEVAVERLVPLDLVSFPHKAETRGVPPVPRLQKANKFFAVKVVVS